jgi:hypothetical protein
MNGEALGGIAVLSLFLAVMAAWIWALVDAIRAPEEGFRSGTRLIWVVVIAVTHVIGAALYVAFGRRARHALA